MPVVRDFRNYTFEAARVDRCGRHIGSKLYWKLYAIENTVRIVLHSVLAAHYGSNWWNVAVDPKIAANAARFRARYAANPRNASPGASDIHIVYLWELTEILRVNNRIFFPIIPDANSWIATLEAIRVPRNLVGHMNFPAPFDRAAIDSAYSQLPALIGHLKTSGIPVLVPK